MPPLQEGKKRGLSFDFTVKFEHLIWIISALIAFVIYFGKVERNSDDVLFLKNNKVDKMIYQRDMKNMDNLSISIDELTKSVNRLNTQVAVLNEQKKGK